MTNTEIKQEVNNVIEEVNIMNNRIRMATDIQELKKIYFTERKTVGKHIEEICSNLEEADFERAMLKFRLMYLNCQIESIFEFSEAH